jgi:hypothetical protein
MLNETRAIVHSYEIHTGTTADLEANDRFYDILPALDELSVSSIGSEYTTDSLLCVFNIMCNGISHQLDHHTSSDINCCRRRASASPPLLLVGVCVAPSYLTWHATI